MNCCIASLQRKLLLWFIIIWQLYTRQLLEGRRLLLIILILEINYECGLSRTCSVWRIILHAVCPIRRALIRRVMCFPSRTCSVFRCEEVLACDWFFEAVNGSVRRHLNELGWRMSSLVSGLKMCHINAGFFCSAVRVLHFISAELFLFCFMVIDRWLLQNLFGLHDLWISHSVPE